MTDRDLSLSHRDNFLSRFHKDEKQKRSKTNAQPETASSPVDWLGAQI